MSEQNKAVVKRWIDSFGEGRAAALAILDEVVTPGYAKHDPVAEVSGREAMRQYVEAVYDGLPDLHFSVDETLADGDRVICRFILHGTHLGELMGFPPTGREIQASGISIFRIEEGKVAEEWEVWDAHGFFQQLSLLETNKVLGRRFFEEVLNKHDWAVAHQICADDFVFRTWHFPEVRGWHGLKQIYEALDCSFADIQYSIKDVIAEGDRVSVYWVSRGIGRGEFMGFNATGKRSNVDGVSMFRMAGGKIVEHSGQPDVFGLLRSIDAWPLPKWMKA